MSKLDTWGVSGVYEVSNGETMRCLIWKPGLSNLESWGVQSGNLRCLNWTPGVSNRGL